MKNFTESFTYFLGFPSFGVAATRERDRLGALQLLCKSELES